MKRLFTFLILNCLLSFIYGQSIIIKGYVLDKETQEPLIGATIIDNNQKGCITNQRGYFELSVPCYKQQLLLINYMGYESKSITIEAKNKNIDLTKVYLQPGLMLEEVIIKKELPIGTQNIDTLAFSAAAFKGNLSAKGIHLIQKLPGFIVKENKIETQGEEIKKVYVDGKPFFEDDPKNALNSIPINRIERLEIIDDYGEIANFTGYASGNTQKVLNIVTKKKQSSTRITDINLGYGTKDRFEREATSFLDFGRNSITLIRDYNNLNKSRNDLSSFKSFEALLSSKLGFNNDDDINMGEQINSSIGANYNYDNKKSKLNLTYVYGKHKNDIKSNTTQNYQDRFFYHLKDTISSDTDCHKTNLKYIFEKNNNKFIVSNRFYKIKGVSNISGTKTNEYESSSNTKTLSNIETKNSQYENTTSILWMHNFGSSNRALTSWVTFKIKEENKDNKLENKSIYSSHYEDQAFTTTLYENEYNNIQYHNNKINLRISYKEPLSLLSNLNVVYTGQFTNNKINKMVVDKDDSSLLLEDLSNITESNYSSNKIELGYSQFRLKFTFNIGCGIEDIQWHKKIADKKINNNKKAVLPLIFGKYYISSKKNITFMLRGITTMPQIGMLQPVVDISDPNKVSIGNPNLDIGSQYIASLKYLCTMPSSAQYLSIFLLSQYNFNPVGFESYFLKEASTFYNRSLEIGTQVVRPINLESSWNIIGGIDYAFPFRWIKSNVTTALKYSYNYMPTVFEEEEIKTNKHTITAKIGIASNISNNFEFFIENTCHYNIGSNNKNENTTNFLYNELKGQVYWKLPTIFELSVGTNYHTLHYFDKEPSKNYFVLDASISKSFFKDHVQFKLSIHDLFKQAQGYAFKYHESYTESITYNTLKPYCMLSAKVKF